jgi:hypothetical protein
MSCDREGTFRARLIQPGLRKGKSPSKSLGVTFVAMLDEMWIADDEGGGHWEPWSQYDMQAEGTSWIVKADGTVNSKAAESLVSHAGWSGDLSDVVEGRWKATPCQVVVKAEEYQGQTYFKVAFINSFDATPGGMGNVDPDEAKKLQDQLGSQFRAIASNAKRNTAPTTGKPSSPPKRAPGGKQPATVASGEEDIPF